MVYFSLLLLLLLFSMIWFDFELLKLLSYQAYETQWNLVLALNFLNRYLCISCQAYETQWTLVLTLNFCKTITYAYPTKLYETEWNLVLTLNFCNRYLCISYRAVQSTIELGS